MDEFKEIRAIIIPAKQLNDFAINKAKEISTKGKTLMQVDGVNILPHFTLYHAEYPIKNLPSISQVMATLAKTNSSEIELDSYYFGWGYLGLGFKINNYIRKLHEDCVNLLSPLSEGHLREKYAAEIASGKYSPEQIEYIQKFGYHNIFNNFHPHLTLVRFEDESLAKRIGDEMNKNVKLFITTVNELGLCEVGPHDTCTKIIGRFPLLRGS